MINGYVGWKGRQLKIRYVFILSDFPQNSSILFSYNEDDAIFMSKRSASGDLIASTKDIYISGTKEWIVHNDSKV